LSPPLQKRDGGSAPTPAPERGRERRGGVVVGFEIESTFVTNTASPTSFTATLSGLASNTTYRYQTDAYTPAGTR
jgi:hypothetical protein